MKTGWFWKENPIELTSKNPSSCSFLSEADKYVFQVVWSHGKALWIEVRITFKAEKEKWIKTKASSCHLQESNLFRPAVLSIGIVHVVFPSLTGDLDIPVVIELKVYLKTLQNSHWRHHQNQHPDYPADLSHRRFHFPSHLRSVCLSSLPTHWIPAARGFQQSLPVCNHYWKLDLV